VNNGQRRASSNPALALRRRWLAMMGMSDDEIAQNCALDPRLTWTRNALNTTQCFGFWTATAAIKQCRSKAVPGLFQGRTLPMLLISYAPSSQRLGAIAHLIGLTLRYLLFQAESSIAQRCSRSSRSMLTP